ncbi:oxalurate catabolism protein HpxZ [Lampropedia puyangensis]|uniref:Oxalurate catabolism protein HpxZ n=1 Tax=Lampropedia puyangensis TaxID=1330072 RepID=A0A4S8EVP1_9BURK|nr:oxalurate catabolism protein HpxZ [Lampropedia puyangensis]THT99007.1 oxalurate catabolism protein HpxZ [Lampropedia puyangensis]
MDINIPFIVEEVSAVFARYEQALVSNDVQTLDALFWNSPHTIRYGASENLYGYDAIAQFRHARSPAGLARTVLRTAITTYGLDLATTNIEFQRTGSDRIGRQSQVWARMPEGWRVVSAHVSVMQTPAAAPALLPDTSGTPLA